MKDKEDCLFFVKCDCKRLVFKCSFKKLEIHNVSAKKKYERVKKENHIAHLNTTITIHTFTTSCFIIIIQFSPNFAPLIVNASATKKTEIVFSRIDSC